VNKVELLGRLQSFKENAAIIDQTLMNRAESEQVHASDSLERLIDEINSFSYISLSIREEDLIGAINRIEFILSNRVELIRLARYIEELRNIIQPKVEIIPNDSQNSETPTIIMEDQIMNSNGTMISVIPTYDEDYYYNLPAPGSDLNSALRGVITINDEDYDPSLLGSFDVGSDH
jgi:hypothetical protein